MSTTVEVARASQVKRVDIDDPNLTVAVVVVYSRALVMRLCWLLQRRAMRRACPWQLAQRVSHKRIPFLDRFFVPQLPQRSLGTATQGREYRPHGKLTAEKIGEGGGHIDSWLYIQMF
jgi:hypothetical protein